jgi:cytochrome c-type biogenesis protein CcmF
MARWKQASLPDLKTRLRWAMLAGLIAAVALPLALGKWSIMIALGTWLATWIFATVIVNLVVRVQSISGNLTVGQKLGKQPRHYYGMLLAHAGVGVFVIGVTFVSGYEQEKDVRMDVGDVLEMGDYSFRFDGVNRVPGPNYTAERGSVLVSKNETPIALLHPEKRVYNVQQNPMTEAAIHSGMFRQLYVSLGEPVGGGAWSVRVYVKPFVTWIWTGCALMALGGVISITDRRYRLATRREKAAAKTGQPGATTKTASAMMEAKS